MELTVVLALYKPLYFQTSQLQVISLQSNDGSSANVAALKGWRTICEVSRGEFEKIYTRLDITLEEKGKIHSKRVEKIQNYTRNE